MKVFVERLLHAFLSLPPNWAVGGVTVLTAAESAFFLGLVVPGEITAVLGGALAAYGHVPLGAMMSAAIVGPWIGDNVGYWIGRRYGARWVAGRRRARWNRARQWLRRRGGFAVFLGRFTPFLRSVMPSAAGTAKMPYPRFLSCTLASGVAWGMISTLAGYFGERNIVAVAHAVGQLGLLLLALAILAAVVFGKRLLARPTRSH